MSTPTTTPLPLPIVRAHLAARYQTELGQLLRDGPETAPDQPAWRCVRADDLRSPADAAASAAVTAAADVPGLGLEVGRRMGDWTPEVHLEPPDRRRRRRRRRPAALALDQGPCRGRWPRTFKDLHHPHHGGIGRRRRPGAEPCQEFKGRFPGRAGRTDTLGGEDHSLPRQGLSLADPGGVALGHAKGGLAIVRQGVEQERHGRIIAQNQASAYGEGMIRPCRAKSCDPAHDR